MKQNDRIVVWKKQYISYWHIEQKLTFRFFPGNALNIAAKGYAKNSDRVYCTKEMIKIS